MSLPLYLAATGAEMSAFSRFPPLCAYMACHFSPYSSGLINLPTALPENAILILNDRMPCCGHSPDLVARQLQDAVDQFRCESVLLDFQRPPEPEGAHMVRMIVETLSCPVAVSEVFAGSFPCPVFLSPAPLHMPLAEHLSPWQNREIWLEAALEQESVDILHQGIKTQRHFPPNRFTEGFYEDALCCHYRTQLEENCIRFTLYDTPESLEKKLELAYSLGVKRAVGLWQELGNS